MQAKTKGLERATSLRVTSDALRNEQERLHALLIRPKSCEKLRAELEQELDLVELWPRFGRMIEENATAIAMEAADIHHESEELVKKIQGYKERLGPTNGNGTALQAHEEFAN